MLHDPSASQLFEPIFIIFGPEILVIREIKLVKELRKSQLGGKS